MNTPTNLFSRERFEAWLVGQPLDREFSYSDCRGCLLASFLKECARITNPVVSDVGFFSTGNGDFTYHRLPDWAIKLANSFTYSHPSKPFTALDALNMYKRLFGVDLMEMDKIQVPSVAVDQNQP